MHTLSKWWATLIVCFIASGAFAQSNKETQPPFSPYRSVNGVVFVSGQIGADPKTGKLVTSSFPEEVKQTMANIQAVLQQARLQFSDVVSVTVYLKNISQYAAFNEVYVQYFQGPLPARTCVAVKELVKNANVEVTVTAAVPNNVP